jgi:hypothetical protein
VAEPAHNAHYEGSGRLPLIVCPTHGRAGRVHTFDVLPDIPLCVAESQAPLYARAHPDAELIVHPDSVVGIASKRQWLVDRYERVMMFDDDLKHMVDLQVGPGEDARIKDPQIVRDLVYRLFDTADQLGAHVCGFNTYLDPALYRPHRPFSLRHMVSGHCLGLIADPRLRLPEMPHLLTDDLYVSALAAFHDRFLLTDNRFGLAMQDTWKDTGGMATHRTWQRIVENERVLKAAFGDSIVRRRNGPRSTLTVEIQLTMKVPW